MVTKTTQISKTNDDNNCTVMALKSVTGWSELKCQSILDKAGRKRNEGFHIIHHLDKCKGKIEDVKLTKILNCRYYKGNNTITLQNFATHRNKGVYYIVTNTHALAIIDGVIVDNLTGRGAGNRREVKYAYKVTGNINPNIGIVSEEDKTAKKRYARLNYGEKVIYLGDTIECDGKIVAKKGDLITVSTQQTNGIVIVKFYHYGKKIDGKYSNYWSATAKIDRTLLQTTKEREIAEIGKIENLIK
jgi:hypothetical protein